MDARHRPTLVTDEDGIPLCRECEDRVGSVEIRPDGTAYCGECSAEWDADGSRA